MMTEPITMEHKRFAAGRTGQGQSRQGILTNSATTSSRRLLLRFAFDLWFWRIAVVLCRHGGFYFGSPGNEAGVELLRFFRQLDRKVLRFTDVIAEIVKFQPTIFEKL